MTSPITRFIRQVLGLMHKKKALRGMQHPDPHDGMPRSLRGRRP